MQSFDYFFGLVLAEKLLRITDNLSKTLQIKEFSASDGQRVAAMSKETLQKMRNEDNFDLFWTLTLQMSSKLDINEPTLPRKRRMPARFETGTALAEFPSTAKDHYRPQYYKALDLLIQTIDDCFDQPAYKAYSCLQNVLLKALSKGDISEKMRVVLNTYSSDFQESDLKSQLEMFAATAPDGIKNISDL